MADPKYVRLADRMARSTQVDIESGWSIAGLDVREFPGDDQPYAQRYVRDAIRRGTIEGCSKAEFDEVYGEDGSNLNFYERAGVTVKGPEIEGHYQEAHVVGMADTERLRIESARGLGGGGLSYKDDKVRRAALMERQKRLESFGDLDNPDEAGVELSEEDQQKAAEATGPGEDKLDEEPQGKRGAAKKSGGKKS